MLARPLERRTQAGLVEKPAIEQAWDIEANDGLALVFRQMREDREAALPKPERHPPANIPGERADGERPLDPVDADDIETIPHQQKDGIGEGRGEPEQRRARQIPQAACLPRARRQHKEIKPETIALAARDLLDEAFSGQILHRAVHCGL